MWFPTRIALIGALILLIFQNATQPAGKQTVSSAKTEPDGSQGSKDTASPSSTVGPSQAVITVHGLCDKAPGSGASDPSSCSKIITREEFERLISVLNPEGQAVPPLARQNLARNYADYLAVEAVAKKAGIEDTPEFRELMNWARLRTATDLYRRSLQEKYRNPSPEEISAYYKQHFSVFERVSLARILVTRENPSAAEKDFDKKALETAKAARERAAKGEDPAQIQKDAYAALGFSVPPSTDLGKRRRSDLIASEAAEVFSLPEGGVTQVQTEVKSYVIYKVLSKDPMTEEEARPEITREIYQQKFKAAMKSVLDAAPAELNKEYFSNGTSSPAGSR